MVLNIDVMLSPGWNLQGELYKALLWGAMNSKVKAVIAAPPTKGFMSSENRDPSDHLSPRYLKDIEMLTKTTVPR